jgi:predicted phage-related endonuclease
VNIVDTTGLTPEQIFDKREYGASLSPGICGVGFKTESRYKAFLLKAYNIKDEHDESTLNLFWWGHELEPLIAKRFTLETGLAFKGHQILVRHPRLPFMTCLLDGLLENDEIVDFKAMTRYGSKGLVDGDPSTLPMRAHVQAAHQMACCETDKAHWACFCGPELAIKKFVIHRNEEVVSLVETLVTEFKELVDTLTPPSEFVLADFEVMRRLFNKTDDEPLCMTDDEALDDVARQYMEAKESRLEAEKLEKCLQAQLLEAMGNSPSADLPTFTLAREWRQRKGHVVKPSKYIQLICRSRFDSTPKRRKRSA